MAFAVKILSWRFRHLNIVVCLLKEGLPRGGGGWGHGHPRTPPSYAPGVNQQLALISLAERWTITEIRRQLKSVLTYSLLTVVSFHKVLKKLSGK